MVLSDCLGFGVHFSSTRRAVETRGKRNAGGGGRPIRGGRFGRVVGIGFGRAEGVADRRIKRAACWAMAMLALISVVGALTSFESETSNRIV
jgi:hypothetical protein